MKTFKITNITGSLTKRHPNYNSTLNISYLDQMERKTMFIEPNKTVYFTADSLPLSLQRFRMKKLVAVVELNEQELLRVQKEKSGDKKENKSEEKKSEPKRKYTTKTTTRKSTSSKSTSGRKSSTRKTTSSRSTKSESEETVE
jgi:hypothetical protein